MPINGRGANWGQIEVDTESKDEKGNSGRGEMGGKNKRTQEQNECKQKEDLDGEWNNGGWGIGRYGRIHVVDPLACVSAFGGMR